MAIAGLDPVIAGTSQTYSSTGDVLGKDDFLKMLVTQLQNQDPLNPMEGTEFTAQLAQFSSLEQLSNVNENLEYLHMYQASLNNSQAMGFIGKTILGTGDSLIVKEGVSDNINFNLGGDASGVFVNIYDAGSNLIRTIDMGAMSRGNHMTEWDVTDDDGYEVVDGEYSFKVLATDAEGNEIDVSTFGLGKVTGVTFKDGSAYVVVGNKELALGSIFKVIETEEL
jgi:flagellar basal-body rod modification protein FlgD